MLTKIIREYNADIKLIYHEVFLELPSSGTLIIIRLETKIS